MLHALFIVVSVFASSPRLEDCIQYWQRTLQLTHWQITIRVVRREELTAGTIGEIDTGVLNKTAVIRVMREQDSDLSRHLARANQRLTMAHEMVHLSKRAQGRGDWQDESATNAETYALLRKRHRWLEMCAVER